MTRENSYGDTTIPNAVLLAAMDALPPRLRLFIDRLPVPINPIPALEDYRAGVPIAEIAIHYERGARAFARQYALETYGPDHPDAQEKRGTA